MRRWPIPEGSIISGHDAETHADASAQAWMPTWRSLSDPAVFVATAAGCGLLPKMPGTWGSLAAVVVWYAWLGPLGSTVGLAVALAVFVLGVWVIGVVQRRYGVMDAGPIVIDEVVGVWIALLAAPVVAWVALLGFAAFRLFDIWKPWPVSWADRQHTPLGVMLDDVLAGVLALGVVQVAILLLQTGAGQPMA